LRAATFTGKVTMPTTASLPNRDKRKQHCGWHASIVCVPKLAWNLSGAANCCSAGTGQGDSS
jgi:hypothetical protein